MKNEGQDVNMPREGSTEQAIVRYGQIDGGEQNNYFADQESH